MLIKVYDNYTFSFPTLISPVFCAGIYQEQFGFLQSLGGFFPPLPFLLLFFAFFPWIMRFGGGDLFFLFLAGYSLSDLYVIWIVPALFCFRNTVSMFQLQLFPWEYVLLAGLETAWVVEPREWWWIVLHPVGSWSQVVMRDWLKLLLAQNNWNRRSDMCSLIREKIFK